MTLTLFAFRTKQFYMFIQQEWIDGDPGQPPPPPERKWIRNKVRVFSLRHKRTAADTVVYPVLETYVCGGRSVDA